MHSLNTKLGVWRLRYKPPNGKTDNCFYISGYLSSESALADIPLLTKHLNIKNSRITSFQPNFGSMSTADSNQQPFLTVTPTVPDSIFTTDDICCLR